MLHRVAVTRCHAAVGGSLCKEIDCSGPCRPIGTGISYFTALATLLDEPAESRHLKPAATCSRAAGLTGGRINKFNITKQSKDYDAEGKYVKHWLPELQRVPVSHIHEPWTMPLALQRDAGCVLGTDYPQPVPVARMARPWQGCRYPDATRNEKYGSRARKGNAGGAAKGAARRGVGRAPVNFY